MDLTSPSPDRTGVRFSESPALSPQIIDSPNSPVRSVYIETMEGHQTEQQLERGGFFDDNTSDEGDNTPRRGQSSEMEPSHTGLNIQNLSLESTEQPTEQPTELPTNEPVNRQSARNSAVSQTTDPTPGGLVYLNNGYVQSGDRGNQPSLQPPDILEIRQIDNNATRPTSLPADMTLPSVSSSNKYEQVANIHAMTLEYLLRSDTEKPPSNSGEDSVPSRPDTSNRKIVIVPQPINVEHTRENDPAIRTPYPFGIRKSLIRQSHISIKDAPNEAILALTLRRRVARKTYHVSQLKIPASPDYVPISSSPSGPNSQPEKHFETLDFDDAHFFRELHRAYTRLAGALHFFSARGLHHIEIAHYDAWDNPCPHDLPRSQFHVISQGLADSFSEANLMRHFRRPRMGKAQYMWVHWAHRLASTPAHLLPPAPVPTAESPRLRSAAASLSLPGEKAKGRGETCVAGLEFVEGWVTWKLLVAVVIAVVLAIAATLLWILVGVSEGLAVNGAASRIIPGCLVGLLLFALGMTMVAMWACISWLVD
jgi:hypothetical protein